MMVSAMSDSISIRRLLRSDAEQYRAFRLAALAATPSAFTSSAEEEGQKPLSWFADKIGDADQSTHFILGAFQNGAELVGVIGCDVEARRQACHKATLFGMAVATHAHGRGIGRALVQRLLSEARQIPGVLQVILTMSEGNIAGERLYRSCGFREFGREPRATLIAGQAITKISMVHMFDDFPWTPVS